MNPNDAESKQSKSAMYREFARTVRDLRMPDSVQLPSAGYFQAEIDDEQYQVVSPRSPVPVPYFSRPDDVPPGTYELWGLAGNRGIVELKNPFQPEEHNHRIGTVCHVPGPVYRALKPDKTGRVTDVNIRTALQSFCEQASTQSGDKV